MAESLVPIVTWIGIAACISQAAMLSGLNLAFFSVSRLRLEVEASLGNSDALTVRDLRSNANFLLTTLLWGNVAVNVLLTLLSDSVLAGVGAFFFSAVVITCLGEIAPQAYFSRNALWVASRLSPIVRVYQRLLYPVARPSAALLDVWLGPEGVQYYRERELHTLIRKHIEADEADIDRLEGLGALNFLAIDDLAVVHEGERLDPRSVISLPCVAERPALPDFEASPEDPFLQSIEASGKKWIVITDEQGEPRFVLDSDAFLRGALFGARRSIRMLIVIGQSSPRIQAVDWGTSFPGFWWSSRGPDKTFSNGTSFWSGPTKSSLSRAPISSIDCCAVLLCSRTCGLRPVPPRPMALVDLASIRLWLRANESASFVTRLRALKSHPSPACSPARRRRRRSRRRRRRRI